MAIVYDSGAGEHCENYIIYDAGCAIVSPCAVGVPEKAPGNRQQYKRARMLDQCRQAETANAEKKRRRKEPVSL